MQVTASDSKAELEIKWIIKVIELPTSIHLPDSKNVNDVISIFPNPMKNYATFEFYLNEPSDILISIYSIHGTRIREFHLKEQSAGSHSVNWNGLSDGGSLLADGVYICRFVIDNSSGRLIQERKIICNRNTH